MSGYSVDRGARKLEGRRAVADCSGETNEGEYEPEADGQQQRAGQRFSAATG